jgi:hypothetical protein
MKTMSVLMLLTLLGGCASTGNQPDYLGAQIAAHNETADEADKIVCRYVKETGTFIKKRRCRTVTQLEREREAAQQAMDQVMSGGTNSSGGEN